MDSSADDPTAASAASAAAADASAAAAGNASVPPEQDQQQQQQKDELAACWAAATAADATNDPSFDIFVSLASAAEKTGDAGDIARALELLLKRFPLCYGYWKKLAEAKARLVGDDESAALAAASEVFERGLAHVGATPELWLSFATKLISSSASSPSSSSPKEGEEKIRAVFERAVSEAGDAWGAGPLWEAFAAWEAGLASAGTGGEENEGGKSPPPSSPRRAAAVLFRGACQPIRDAEVLRARLHELASRHSVSELAASEEEAEAARTAARPEGGGGEGEDAGVADAAAAAASEAAARSAWLSTLEGSSPEFSSGLALRARRYPFEARIRRAYWNSKPLDADQLRAWWSLLDDAEGLLVPMPTAVPLAGSSSSSSCAASAPCSRGAIDRLYRRCLVACAAYPEFWRRRARWLLDNEEEEGAKANGGEQQKPSAAALEAARAAASAAADFHCRSRPETLLFASRLDEAAGDFDAEREKLVRARDVVSPGLAAASAAVAHLDRRRAVSEFLSSSAAASKKGGGCGADSERASAAAAPEEEARRRGAAAARLTLSESIDKAAAANTAASLSCVAALSLQAAALTNDDADVKSGRDALAKGLRAAPGEAAVWEAAATFEARWGDKEEFDGGVPSAPRSAVAVAVAILQAAAAPPASSVPGLERAIAEARAEKKKEKNEKKSSEGEGRGREENGKKEGEQEEETIDECDDDDEEEEGEEEEEEIPLVDLHLPADAVRRARAAGFPLQAPFTPPGWPCPLPESKLSHGDRAALSARSIALAEASSSAAAAANGGSGVSILRDAASLHDQRFGYAQAAAANVAASAAAAQSAGGGAGGIAGAKRPFVPGGGGQQQQWQPRPRAYYPRPHYNPHWQQQQYHQQQQYQQWPQQQQYQQQQQWAPQNYQKQP